MNRSPYALRWIAPSLLLVVVAALVALLSPTVADAQEDNPAALSLAVSPADAVTPFRTVALALDAGDSGLAAIGATIHFDPDLIIAGSCSVSEVGACNVIDDGQVLMSVFSLSGLRSNDQLLTVNFEPAPGATGTTAFELTVETAVSAQGAQLPTVVEPSVPITLASVDQGSLTGDVLDSESAVGLFALDVCATHDVTQIATCTTSSGLGTWRIDELPVGDYTIGVTDAAGVYASAVTLSTVTADDITAGIVTNMTLASADEAVDEAIADEAVDEATTVDEQSDLTTEVPAVQATAPIVIVYEASIAGRVTALDAGQPIEALQVCATQPLVLHQSCATTGADGVFTLDELSTGNYWITVVDPLGYYAEPRPKLVGVVGSDVVRTGVNIGLTAIAD